MIKFFSIALIVTAQFFSTPIHEYYVGLTEIKFNSEKERLEIISRLFHDDFENVLKVRYDKSLTLRPSKQSENVEAYIKLYFEKKLLIETDGQKQPLSYVGYKFDEDRINVFFKVVEIKDFNKINIQNLLLTDVIEEQKNIVHCFKLKQKESVLLTRFDSEAMLKFN